MTWVKICGTTNLEDARAAVEAGADALGFVFAPSPRRIKPNQAKKIIAKLPVAVEKVGVFVNQQPDIVLYTVEKAGLTAVQLHGDENGEFISALHLKSAGAFKIYRALPMSLIENSVGEWGNKAREAIFAILVDSSTSAKRGGTGKSFDWESAAPMLRFIQKRYRVIVAGGLTPANVVAVVQLLAPWGVDVASGVERKEGSKDHNKVHDFVKAAKGIG